ncbi:hypothetical protein GCM10010168_35190 [Actinoplanes ianthinogenes]|uniref:Uncharacterized protein n=1 Tax=Actinoplanes ianthinogenes TaxID=122358 RepID=A0ABM7M5N9_9ACTN|nr:hypothetical protein [Actinoplanes ianthinogenes]BCJ46961.1 hypothetical protein Aiant_76180 [Actinoplanes ianthinogenes]GGR14345.1 hypothetical protein GCM10010168_35190 [Actinoplanes ianthinogenes]
MTDERCPGCDGELRMLGFLLCLRAEDQKRVCRTPAWCPRCDRAWFRWADRPDDALEEDTAVPPGFYRRMARR